MNLSCSHRLTDSELSKVKSFFGEWETKASMANTGSEILKLQLEFNQSALAFFSKVLSENLSTKEKEKMLKVVGNELKPNTDEHFREHERRQNSIGKIVDDDEDNNS